MIVVTDVDDYTKTLNHRKYYGVLLTLNQLNMVLKLELSSKIFFCFQCCHWGSLQYLGNFVGVFFIFDLSTVLCFSKISSL